MSTNRRYRIKTTSGAIGSLGAAFGWDSQNPYAAASLVLLVVANRSASGAVRCRTVWNSYSPPQRAMIQKDLTSCSHGTLQRRTRKGLKLVRRKH
jgi:hypothetical protein